jgi:hypothetical protein
VGIIDPITGQEFTYEDKIKEFADQLPKKEETPMPDWHKDIAPRSRINVGGHWFEIYGIDPERPNDLILTYKRPSNKALKRMRERHDSK